MFLKNSIIYFLLKKREKDIDNFISNPIKYQDQTFSYLIMNGEKTMYGKKYNFNKIKNYKDFKDNVPIYTYEELEKYIDLIRKEKEIFYGLEKLKDSQYLLEQVMGKVNSFLYQKNV